ncbi:MAG: ATP-binding protein [Proteobacteria bacterium]|nr:ATP-binding protein [Pseudomonadota bacterium]MBU1641164.1 ATP-binding protein [Pseudomonadota bacterium]
MQIAVASGKGGTGKTTVSTSLALCAGSAVQFLDCDVEEPNGHIFLKPELTESIRHTVTIPRILTDHCTYCGKCRNICRFNAITMFGQTIISFTELCHSCLGCFLVCEDNAIVRDSREIGVVERGQVGDIDFVHGRIRVGEPMAVPLIKAVKTKARKESLVIIDAPPGTSCPFVESVCDADFVLLVTEPTPFGLHDLKLTVQVLRTFAKPCGVLINRADLGDERVERWCQVENIPVMMKIPFDRIIAEGYARGETLVESRPALRKPLENLLQELVQ